MDKRSLADALDLTPNQNSFVEAADEASERSPTKRKPKNETKQKVVERVPYSARVSRATVEKLALVAGKRKARKKHPYSQQAIVEAAIEDWLKRNT